MHRFSIDYRKDRGERRGTLVDRGFFVHGLPRLIPLCRLFGHKPVVDGTSTPARWVCCNRCGVRRSPQGSLKPSLWDIGDPFIDQDEYDPTEKAPGPWPANPTGEIGGQLVIGKSVSGFSVEFALGCAGDEHTLSGHVRINPLGGLYLHTEGFGNWLQRRFNAVGYDTREVGLSAHDGRVYWKLWAKQGSWSSDDPKWMQGSFPYDLRDVALGRKRYSHEDVGDKVNATVWMPHGDDHQVELQLRRQTHGRKHGRKELSWTVDWDCKAGIPVRVDDGWKGGSIYGSGVKVSDAAVEAGTWPYTAAAAIAEQMMRDRTRYQFTPAQVDDAEPMVEL